MFNFPDFKVPIQKIEGFPTLFGMHELYILREDQMHLEVSGNKYRKLKYNFLEAQSLNSKGLLSFGGAYSNHIAALAALGKQNEIPTVGIIRGEELFSKIKENPTLSFAVACGMQLDFISRQAYKKKEETSFINTIKEKFENYYIIPEGGTNNLAVKGCEEILSDHTHNFDYLCVPVGTGGTMSGIVKASLPHQTVLGFSALKGTFQEEIIKKYTHKTNFELLDDYCFGGYGKIDETLIRFINEFKIKTTIALDPIYTGKMMYGIFELVRQQKLKKNSRILAIHTGGLQGITGMNQKLKKKQLPQIE
ncbi:MAG: 1-aminocyclopropane-1-carboxylate deaminase/D-cysteine desulfhydrase [Flavobacteriaceae bacterium]|nr:1-aminocyclopropane-1-carboxylate deaminase/D-cysteine desulfhydrase [Flavobacteriaceae bacterium]